MHATTPTKEQLAVITREIANAFDLFEGADFPAFLAWLQIHDFELYYNAPVIALILTFERLNKIEVGSKVRYTQQYLNNLSANDRVKHENCRGVVRQFNTVRSPVTAGVDADPTDLPRVVYVVWDHQVHPTPVAEGSLKPMYSKNINLTEGYPNHAN